ncbi:MAG: transporter substrate-binding domain-containing protein [Clostridia bacterium]|nr:transporter substrate-binding domain-containing protein [Clostridia bacterium]
MICPNCSAELPANSAFCTNCGMKIIQSGDSDTVRMPDQNAAPQNSYQGGGYNQPAPGGQWGQPMPQNDYQGGGYNQPAPGGQWGQPMPQDNYQGGGYNQPAPGGQWGQPMPQNDYQGGGYNQPAPGGQWGQPMPQNNYPPFGSVPGNQAPYGYPAPPKKNKSKWIIIIVVVVLFIAAVAAALFFVLRNRSNNADGRETTARTTSAPIGVTGVDSTVSPETTTDNVFAQTIAPSFDTGRADIDLSNLTTVEPGYLTVVINATFPPYEYFEDDTGLIIGIDIDIASLIAYKLGLYLRIEDRNFDEIIPSVQNGRYDMGIAGMSVTEDRLRNVSFSDTYAVSVQSVIVPESGAIASVDDIKGDGSMTIGVQQGTVGSLYAADDYGYENVINYKSGPDAVQALVSGRVDCVIIDSEPAKAYVAANSGLRILDTAYAEEDYAICVAKENTALLDAVNAVLADLIDDGSVKRIIDKYIG